MTRVGGAAVLRDRFAHVHLLELFDAPVGYVAFDADTVLHLGVVAHQTRRGYGSALIEFACLEIFSGGVPEASFCWVLTEKNGAAPSTGRPGWTETDDRRKVGVPALPEEIRMKRRNPAAPRRSR